MPFGHDHPVSVSLINLSETWLWYPPFEAKWSDVTSRWKWNICYQKPFLAIGFPRVSCCMTFPLLMMMMMMMMMMIFLHGSFFGEEQYPSKVTLQKNARTTFTLLWLLERLYHHHPTCGISIRIYYVFCLVHATFLGCYLLPSDMTVVISFIYIFTGVFTFLYTYTRTGLTLTI